MLSVSISLLAGISIVIARIINTNLAKKIGVFEGTLINYIVGLVFSFLFLLLSKDSLYISREILNLIPWWAYLGGVVGIAVVMLSTYMTPRIPSFYLTLLIFIGQFSLGIIIDYVSLDLLSAGKILGGILVLIGLTYNLTLDKKIVLTS